MMDIIKKLFGIILGAGMGWFGTTVRVAVAAAAGYFVTKGFIDETTAGALTDQIVAVTLSVLAAIGSALNNEVQLKKPSP